MGIGMLLFIFMRAFFLMDVSRAPIKNQLQTPLYLISYADGPEVFLQNQKMLAYSALKNGVSHIFNYNKQMLDPFFVEKHRDIFAQKHGAGLWLWKPWIILDALKKIPENAYVFYCDSGFVIKGDLRPILDLLKTHNMVLVFYPDVQKFGTLGKMTKKEALIKTGCDTIPCQKAPLIWAGFLCMKNTPRTRAFIGKWLSYCEQHDLLDNRNTQPEHSPERHHYDQSLLGITYHQYPQGIALVSDQDIADNNILRWHHRHANRGQESLFFDYNKITRIERFIINTPIFQKIAQWVYSEGN